MSNLLINEPPLQVLPSLAKEIGLNKALFLQQLHYWLGLSKNIRDGRKWVYKTAIEWQDENFPFWSVSTVSRIIKGLEDDRLILSGEYNKMRTDRTKWYTIDYDQLKQLEAFSQNGDFDDGNLIASGYRQSDQLLPEKENTTRDKSRHQSSKQKTPGAYTIPTPENTERDPLIALWEKVGGVLTGSVAEYIADWQNTYSAKEVETAIGIAGRKGKLQVKYVEGILRNQASEAAAKEAQASRESSLDRKLMNAAKPYEVDTSMADTNAALLEKMRKNNG